VGQPVRLAALHQALTNSIFPFPGDDTYDSDADFPQTDSPMSAKDKDNTAIKTPSFSLLTLKPRKASKTTLMNSLASTLLCQRQECEVIPQECEVFPSLVSGGRHELGVCVGGSMLSTSEGVMKAASGRVRVLLADDDATQRNSLLQVLVGEGFEVDAVGDGSEALSRTARVVYDAVLMDGFMPVQVLLLRSKIS
jgi:CheY-like chemotaxis protein